MSNSKTIPTTWTNPGRLDVREFTYTARTVTIRGITFVRMTCGSRAYPRGYVSLDAAERVAASIRREQEDEGKDERAQVVRFGATYAVAINALPERDEDEEPRVGAGFTFGGNGDLYPGTIVAVRRNGREVDVVRCGAHVERGQAYQEGPKAALFYSLPYAHECEPDTYTLRKDGRWFPKGSPMGGFGGGRPGWRGTAYNPHF